MRTALLSVAALDAFYGEFQALFGMSLHVDAGECVALVGSNGAGKSTLLKSIAGLLPARADTIRLAGAPIGHWLAEAIVRNGIALVPEGRRLFSSLSVEENLLMGAHAGRAGAWTLDRVYALFPNIAERRSSAGTALSGGQQQMVAIGRALMANPRLLLCDEASLGLAPVVVRELYARLASIRAEGMAMIIVEQDISQAMVAADRLYCLRSGRVALEGSPRALSRQAITEAYFGLEGVAHAGS
ncbi:ABC transporter ATP-binding protein [Bradyrhizobium sp. U87765 SZCCT0131]|nr:ABC transporter ATP-binding protein [Bradyrhizobium sp. U87765 SZCCT0131]MBR1264505.1 ABC transporter ATP-binding protein [Bradyrhizobium sp. U87765 SZCCT0134]MBR1304588.1 ABC transporter ATP-binding protein [Bradyrhizobium sp. U87765 SZCCT0110]MBR1322555.1 ABC transporter ATP-binding protein [Bradyrhizobium sp. U87765 SZCCT0109]MBR1346517.1 ABC transporter ATP-binding protein [Bradyrhizobium sp. U87765 SZCCT0048]